MLVEDIDIKKYSKILFKILQNVRISILNRGENFDADDIGKIINGVLEKS